MNLKKIKFNIVDAIIAVAIIAVIVFLGIKLWPGEDAPIAEVTAQITFYCEEVPDFAAKIIKEGDTASDQAKNISFGKITKITSENALIYTTDANGARMPYVKENVKNIKITSEVKASEFIHGIIIEGAKYSVGHSLTLYAGKTKIPAVISAIETK